MIKISILSLMLLIQLMLVIALVSGKSTKPDNIVICIMVLAMIAFLLV